MAVFDAVLRIGSAMGPGGLASLQAGIQMVGRLGGAVLNVVKELDKFSKVLEKVDMRMVNYADAAAKGQVDTFELMKSLESIQHAFANTGAEFYKEDLALMAKASTNLAKITGKDATTAFKKLAESVSKGTTRALKEYGIYVSQGTDLGKTHKQILDKLREGYGDLEIKLTHTSEKLSALNNNWDTFTGLVYDAYTNMANASGVLDVLNEKLSALNTILSEGGAEVREYMFSLEGAYDSLRQMLGLSDDFKKKMNFHQMISRTKAETKGIMEGAQAPQPQGGTPKGVRKTGGSGNLIGVSEGDDVDAIQRMSDADYYADVENWARMTGMPFMEMEDMIAAEQSFRQKPAKLGYGGPQESSGRFSNHEQDKENVDQKLADMQVLEDQRNVEFQNWLDRYNTEREARQEQLQFAGDFKQVWRDAMDGVSAGTMAAQASMDLMRGTWNAAMDSAITGQQGFGKAIKNMLKDLGLAIAKEAGWHALMEFAMAVASAARQQYGKAAKHAASGAMFAALAGTAAGVSASINRDNSTSGAPKSGTHVRTDGPSYGQSYPSGGSQRQNTEVHVYLEGDAKGVFNIVQKENGARRRGDQTSFAEAS